MKTLVRSVCALSFAALFAGCADDAGISQEPAALASSMYPEYIKKLELGKPVVIESVVAQTDMRPADTFTAAEWSSIGWLPLPGGLVRNYADEVIFNPKAAMPWPPRSPTQDGPKDERTEVAVLLVTARIGDIKANYQVLLMNEPEKGTKIVDPFLASIRVNSPRFYEADLQTAPAGPVIEKKAFPCDNQQHYAGKFTAGRRLVGTCTSFCDDDYAVFTAGASASVTLTCSQTPNGCAPTNISYYQETFLEGTKYHDKELTDIDRDDSWILNDPNRESQQLECDYAWPCSRDFIGVSWEQDKKTTNVYNDDRDNPMQVGAAASAAAHGVVTSHGTDVYFNPLAAISWGLAITTASSAVMSLTSIFSLNHSLQIQAHRKIDDAFVQAIAVCDPTLPVMQPMQPVATATAE